MSPLSPHVSAPGVFWCAWTVFAAVSHTSDHLEEQSRSSPQPLYLSIREPLGAITLGSERRGKYQKRFPRVLDTWTTRGPCVRAVVHLFFLLRALFVTLFYICTRFLRVIIGMLFCAYSVTLSERDSSLSVSVFGFLMFVITSVLSVIRSGLH